MEDWESMYMRYTGQLEAPSVFHRWVAMATVGLVLGRKVWFSRNGVKALYPGQIMVILVADSGTMRKTTAIDQGRRLLREANKIHPGIINILPDRTSPQKLLYRLQPRDENEDVIPGKDCVAAIIAGEMGAYFSQEGYLDTLATHITALNDAPHGRWLAAERRFADWEHILDFMGAGQTKLLNPCIGMLTATTPTGLAKELPEAARTGGFLGRTLMAYASYSDRAPNPMIAADPIIEADCYQTLVEGLVWMGENVSGLARLTPEAEEVYTHWYLDVDRPRADKHRATLTAWTGYNSRKTDHVLRLSMILAAMTQAGERGEKRPLWIYPNHVRYSISLLDSLEQHFDACMAQFDRGTREGLQGRILRYLGRHTTLERTQRQIFKRMHRHGYNTSQVRDTLRDLLAAEEVQRGEGVVEHGKLLETYRWVEPHYPRNRWPREAPDHVGPEEHPELEDEDDELRMPNYLLSRKLLHRVNGTKWGEEAPTHYQPEDIDR